MLGGLLTLAVCSTASFVAGVEIGRRHPDDAWGYIGDAVRRAGRGIRESFKSGAGTEASAPQPLQVVPHPAEPQTGQA